MFDVLAASDMLKSPLAPRQQARSAAVDAELSIEVAHGFSRCWARRRAPRRFAVPCAFNEEAQHILFPAGEVVGAGGLGAEWLRYQALAAPPGRPAASQRSRFSPVANALLRASWRLRASNDSRKRRPVRLLPAAPLRRSRPFWMLKQRCILLVAMTS